MVCTTCHSVAIHICDDGTWHKDGMCFCTTALLSEECLTILIRGVHNHSPLGQLLGIEESTLEAIATYYNNTSELIIGHMIVMWLMHDPESPVKQLSEGLNAIGEHETATKLTLLSSLGEEVCNITYCKCCGKHGSGHM